MRPFLTSLLRPRGLSGFLILALTLAIAAGVFVSRHGSGPVEASSETRSEAHLDSSLSAALAEARHRVSSLTQAESAPPQNSCIRAIATNPGQRLTARFSPEGMCVTSGRGALWQAVFRAVTGEREPVVAGNRVEYRGADLTEWHVNTPEGFEQGWTVAKPRDGTDRARLLVRLDGVSARFVNETSSGHALELVTPQGVPVLSYGKLLVTDVHGRKLDASMRPVLEGVEICWNDTGATYPVTVDPLIASLETKFGQPDTDETEVSDYFGSSFDIDGDTAVVSAPGDGPAGAVFVFNRRNDAWYLHSRLSDPAPRPSGEGKFGYGCAIQGNRLAVVSGGLPPAGQPDGKGKVCFFELSGNVWTHTQSFVPEGIADYTYTGGKLAFDGDTLLVGTVESFLLYTYPAQAFVFKQTAGVWAQEATLNLGGETLFPLNVALSGDTAVVGSAHLPGPDGTLGSAQVFTRTAGVWSWQATLQDGGGPDPTWFGDEVAVHGDTAMISAPVSARVHVYNRTGNTWTEQAPLLPGAGTASGHFGVGLVFDGERALVSSGSYVPQPEGALFLYARNGTAWEQQSYVPSASRGTVWRNQIALDGDRAVFGVSRMSEDPTAYPGHGEARVYLLTGNTLAFEAKLNHNPAPIGRHLGNSVAVSGDTAVIGIEGDDPGAGVNAGSCYVFTRAGNKWTEQARLTPGDLAAGDNFGHSVAISGDTILVGSWRADAGGLTNSGAAYVFTRTAGVWTQQAKLVPTGLGAAGAFDEFGCSVSLSDNFDGMNALIGAWRKDTAAGNDTGRAFVFVRSGTAWNQTHELGGSGEASGDLFGASVSLSNYVAAVGAPGDDTVSGEDAGSVRVFERMVSLDLGGGFVWTQRTTLAASPANAFNAFGTTVAASNEGATILAGAPGADNGAGGAWVFQRSGNTWPAQQRLTPETAEQDDHFGGAVALDGDTALVGAPWDDGDVGSAWVYSRVGNVWSRDSRISSASGGAGHFASCLALSGSRVLVGAPNDDSIEGALAAGRAYFYQLSQAQPSLVLRDGPSIASPQLFSGGSALNLGSTSLGSPLLRTLTLHNTGNSALSLGPASASVGFTVANAPASVAAGSSATFLLRFEAAAPGASTGLLTVSSNDPAAPSFTLDLEAFAVDPMTVDTDADGIADFYEIAYLGTLNLLTATGDYDGDGVGDVDEFNAYSDATDATDKLKVLDLAITPLPDTGSGATDSITLTWASRSERVYFVEWSTDLDTWTRVNGTPTPGLIGQTQMTFTLPKAPRRFYRVAAELPTS